MYVQCNLFTYKGPSIFTPIRVDYVMFSEPLKVLKMIASEGPPGIRFEPLPQPWTQAGYTTIRPPRLTF